MTSKLSAGDKFVIMCDIEKRAKELTKKYEAKGGITEEHAIIGYKMYSNHWRDAKDAGFRKEYGKLWTGFRSSYAGNGGYADRAYTDALDEFRTKLPNTFLSHVYVYEYLT